MSPSSSSRRSSNTSSASTSKTVDTKASSSRSSCNCLQCGPEPEFCRFPTERKSDENFEYLRYPLPQPLQTKIDTLRFGRSDDPLVHLHTLADLEDEAFNSFMQAACQYRKSSLLVVASCKKLIHWSSGMSLESLETATVVGCPETEKHKWWGKATYAMTRPSAEKITKDASIVRLALIGALLNTVAVSTMAKIVTEVRSTVASSTAENTCIFNKFTNQTMPAAFTAMLSEHFENYYWNADFSSYARDHKRLAECLEVIQENVAMTQDNLQSKIALKYAADAKNATMSAFQKIQSDIKSNPEAYPSKAACNSAQKTIIANMRMLEFLNQQLYTATETTSILIGMATRHGFRTRWRARLSAVKHLPGKLAPRAHTSSATKIVDKPSLPHDKTDKNLLGYIIKKQLEQAHLRHMDSSTAVQQAKKDIQSAAAAALKKPLEYRNGTNNTIQRICLETKTATVYKEWL